MVLVRTPNGGALHQAIAGEAKDRELLKSIRGYPCRLSFGDVQNEPGEVPTMVASGLVVPEDELPPLLPREREAEGVPGGRTSDDMSSWRSTASRRAAETGRAPENHSETCRKRKILNELGPK